LNFTGDLEFTGDAFALSDLGGEVFKELSVFKSEAGLGGYGLEELAVSFRVGLFGAFWAEGDDTGETVASGKRDEEFGGEVVEGVAFGIGGVDEPAGRVVAIDIGGGLGTAECCDGSGGRGKGEELGAVQRQRHSGG